MLCLNMSFTFVSPPFVINCFCSPFATPRNSASKHKFSFGLKTTLLLLCNTLVHHTYHVSNTLCRPISLCSPSHFIFQHHSFFLLDTTHTTQIKKKKKTPGYYYFLPFPPVISLIFMPLSFLNMLHRCSTLRCYVLIFFY